MLTAALGEQIAFGNAYSQEKLHWVRWATVLAVASMETTERHTNTRFLDSEISYS